MKKIAIITAGVLPVPAVRGGAVETLVDFIINENERENKINITVFSTYDNYAIKKAKDYKNCSFEYIKINKILEGAYKVVNKVIYKLLGKKLNLNKLYINKVCKTINKNKFDHIIIENRSDYVLDIKNLIKSKVSLHIHNDYLNAEIEKGKEIIDSCNKVLTVSKYIKNRALTLGEQYNDKIYVLKNCTDINKFNKTLYYDFRREFREKNNILEDDIVIMFSGRIHETKGIKELIIAFSKVKNNNAKLLVVGSSWYSSNDKTEYNKEVEELSYKIRDKIIFTGFIPFTEMPKIHSVADIAVVPSIWEEPAGLVVIEAMSSGLPIITTNVGGIPEYIDEECAIMHKRDDNLIKCLQSSLEKLINDKEKRDILGEKARQYVLKYNTKQYYKNFIEILRENNE